MSMARFDLAAVDPDIEPFVRKSVGGSMRGKLRPPGCDHRYLHPAYQFIRLPDSIADDDWTDSLDDLPRLQKTPSARLGRADPRLFQLRGPSEVEREAHREAMRIRLREPAFHLFLQERSATEFVVEFGPLVRDPRTSEIMPSLFDGATSPLSSTTSCCGLHGRS
jgi:hypothetical protein